MTSFMFKAILTFISINKNYQAISKKYHAKTLFTQKFINLMYTIDLLVWQSIYVIFFISLGFIILLPITIIMIVYYF